MIVSFLFFLMLLSTPYFNSQITSMSQSGLNATEKRASISLAVVFGLRMLGLFMIMPVFALYGQHLEGFSPLWVGIAIGAYGLTQAVATFNAFASLHPLIISSSVIVG